MTVVDPHAVIIPESELYRMKICSTIKTAEEERADREANLLIKEAREKQSKERKLRMIELGEVAKKNARKSDSELAKESREKAIREMAEDKMIENSDVVKLLTTLGTRAAAFTIRDRQLEEKKHREEVEEEYNRRLDMMMEVDRLKDLQRRDEEENLKRGKRLESRTVITEQIEQRHRQKLIALEAREQENIAMRNMKKKFEDDDLAAAERRKVAVEASRLEVLLANEDAIKRKQDSKLREREEMEEILRYQAQRDAELARREEEEERLAHQKKEAQMRMLATQERANNNQSEVDELRARRAVEEKERKFRAQERENALKRKSDLKELTVARVRQAEDKQRRQEAERANDIYEYTAAMEYKQRMLDREEKEARAKMEAAEQHRKGIQSQIEANDLNKKMCVLSTLMSNPIVFCSVASFIYLTTPFFSVYAYDFTLTLFHL